jgi:hypothetical protein
MALSEIPPTQKHTHMWHENTKIEAWWAKEKEEEEKSYANLYIN